MILLRSYEDPPATVARHARLLFEHGSELENTSNEPCIICMMLYMECIAHQTDHFADVFVRYNIEYHYNVRKYTADAILFREIQCQKIDNLMFKQPFQCELGWNKVKYARITITYVCVIALTLAGSLG